MKKGNKDALLKTIVESSQIRAPTNGKFETDLANCAHIYAIRARRINVANIWNMKFVLHPKEFEKHRVGIEAPAKDITAAIRQNMPTI
jgi:hypothetical protein